MQDITIHPDSEPAPAPCEHEWKRFKERIYPDRPNDESPLFTRSEAYFIVRACIKCHEKIRIDYKVL